MVNQKQLAIELNEAYIEYYMRCEFRRSVVLQGLICLNQSTVGF